MRRSLQTLVGVVVIALLIAGPVAFAFHQQAQMRNFRVVREGVLYRSGQMTVAGLRRVVHDYGIRTVVTLRDVLDGPPGLEDREEERFCAREEIGYARIPPQSWDLRDGVAAVDAGVQRFRGIMADPQNYPVLLHCFAGIHRTGAYTAIYRMECQGWSNERAIAEVKACGYENLDYELDILGYLESYKAGSGATLTAP
jgi:tyrosine-protein phosphatase SIW14